MNKVIITVVATIMIGFLSPISQTMATPVSVMPNVTPPMFYADYWIGKMKHPDDIIMQGRDIEKFNAEIIKKLPSTVYDLKQYPDSLSQEKLNKLLSVYTFPHKAMYIGDNMIGDTYYQGLKNLMNFEKIDQINTVQYGFTVKRANIRTFPTADVVLEQPGDNEFDQFQETAVDPAQPLIILHTSKDGKWYYVQTYNYLGWMEANSVAISTKEEWTDYQDHNSFLVVTGSILTLGFNPYSPELSELAFSMGPKLPLAKSRGVPRLVDNQTVAGNYVITLPIRNADGSAAFKQALVSVANDVHEGYIPYTRANIIRQAFKMQGQRYGWGGGFHGRDCSAFIKDTYAVFGFHLPRNAGEQEKSAGMTVAINDKATVAERNSVLKSLQPGAALYMRGHVMMYLGEDHGRCYIIHDTAAQGDPEQRLDTGGFQRLPVNQVTVTDVGLIKPNGKQLVELLRTTKQIEFDKK